MSINTIKINKIETDGVDFSGRNVIYVSKGSAATDTRGTLSKYDANVPFATINAAKDSAESGDLILVCPGTYDERIILVDGVNLHFLNGAVVNYSGDRGSVITDYVYEAETQTPVNCRITGDGVFIHSSEKGDDTGPYNAVVALAVSGSEVFIEGLIFDGQQTSQSGSGCIVQDSGKLTVFAKQYVKTSSYDAIWIAAELNGEGEFYLTTPLVWVTSTGDNAIEALPRVGVLNIGRIFHEALGVLCVNGLRAGTTLNCSYIEGGGVRLQGGTIVNSAILLRGSATDAADNALIFAGSGSLLQNCKVVRENASHYAVLVNVSGSALLNCIIVAGSDATNSIYSPSAVDLKVYGSNVANKSVNANVTQQVGTVTVDANVS